MNARAKNIKGAFKVRSVKKYTNYKNIILFDDVTTTGSTLKESAKVLKKDGYQSVWGLTICK